MQILETAVPDKNILIQVDSQIMGGTPVIYGTRIPVYVIFELLQADYSIAEIVEEIYPHLTYKQIYQTLFYINRFFYTQQRIVTFDCRKQGTKAFNDRIKFRYSI